MVDEKGCLIEEVDGFLPHLTARGCSPNTVEAYAYDLLHFYRFLNEREVGWEEFTPALSLDYLEHLGKTASRNGRARSFSLALVAGEGSVTMLSPATINRAIACVSSFYDYLSFSGRSAPTANPILKKQDPALARVPEHHRPFLEGIVRSHAVRRVARVKTAVRLPRAPPTCSPPSSTSRRGCRDTPQRDPPEHLLPPPPPAGSVQILSPTHPPKALQKFPLNVWCELHGKDLSGRCPRHRVGLPPDPTGKGTDSSCSTWTPSSPHFMSWLMTSSSLSKPNKGSEYHFHEKALSCQGPTWRPRNSNEPNVSATRRRASIRCE